jgi:adenylate kinase family enzyme
VVDETRIAPGLTLGNVLWIGGSTCSGKSAIAERIAERRGIPVYHVDEHEQGHAERATAAGFPVYERWLSMTLTERWAFSPVDELVADTLALSEERLPLILEDIGDEAVVVEGFQIYPWLVAPLLESPRQGIWLVCTPEFRRATHFGRPHAWITPRKTDDPERAQANRLERDDRIGEEIARRGSELGMKVIVVDGSRGIDDIAAETEAHLELTTLDSAR